MQELFCRVLEMSLMGCFCICVVLLIRLLLIKCGRKYAYYLWMVIFLNLLVPVTIRGRFSLIPKQAAEISVEMDAQTGGLLLTGNSSAGDEDKDEGSLAETKKQAEGTPQPENIRQMETEYKKDRNVSSSILLIIWLSGLSMIVIYNMVHVVLCKRKISSDKWVHWDDKQRIAEVNGLPTPFLWGIVRPIIFLPTGLEKEEREFITMHERCHRRRGDSYIKLLAFAAVAVHWFNPAVWAAWILFCRDMEISCDEEVLASAGRDIRSQYAQSLLRYAARQSGYLVAPAAFGTPSARTRIENILHFHKHGKIRGWAAGMITIGAVFGLTIHPMAIEQIPDVSGYIDNGMDEVLEAVSKINERTESEESVIAPDAWHREGYVEAAVTHINESLYFTPGLRGEDELDSLAQKALQELYDLTGFQTESCVYSCCDIGMFFFAKTEEDLRHDRIFYRRDFGEKEGYGDGITCMDIASARRFWFSDVQQLDIPGNIEEMEEDELAIWFLQRSSIYQGEEIMATEPSPDLDAIRIVTADGSFYEVTLDMPIQAVRSIFGPYPKGYSH
ncbi:MAG: M56 family metallopeptidase [Lachnospiraceae bacterium]|nr:M56 family metallopeptidase [Lachnospiraceae bacterium]